MDGLLTDVDTYKLDAWEPEIAVEAYALILTVLRLQKNPELESRIESVVKKVCVLDPATALKIV